MGDQMENPVKNQVKNHAGNQVENQAEDQLDDRAQSTDRCVEFEVAAKTNKMNISFGN